MDGSRNRRGGRQYGKLHFLSAPCVTPPSKTSTSPSQLATASGGRSLNDVLTSKTSSKHAFQTPLPVIQALWRTGFGSGLIVSGSAFRRGGWRHKMDKMARTGATTFSTLTT